MSPRRIFLGLFLCIASQAHAQTTREQAKQHFLNGVELFNHGELARALPEFEGSYQLNPVPEVLFNIALTQKGIHHYADAVHSLKRFLQETEARTTPLTPKRRTDAQIAIAEIRAQMGAAILQVSPPTATVLLDGREPEHEEALMFVDPGAHRFDVSAPGYRGARIEFTALSGKTQTLHTDLVREAPAVVGVKTVAAPVVVPATPPPGVALVETNQVVAAPPPRKPVWKRPALWIGIGAVVVVGVVAGTVAGVLTHDNATSCSSNCADFSRSSM